MKLVLAARNMHKIEEIKTLLSDLPLEISTLHNFVNTPEVEEDGSSYAENALKKLASFIRTPVSPRLQTTQALRCITLRTLRASFCPVCRSTGDGPG